MANRLVIRGGQKLLGTVGSGTGDPILTRDATTKEVGEIPAIDPSVYLSTGLNSGQLFVGNASNLAQARTITGAISFNNTGVALLGLDIITDANIFSGAGISYSKLNLANQIVNNDISLFASITRTKLASGNINRILINNGAGVFSEQAAITGNRLLISDANGLPIASSITDTTAAFLDPTSSVQTQLNNRLLFSSTITPVEGDLVYYNGSTWNRLPRGTSGQYLAATASTINWVTVPNGMPVGGTTNQYLKKNSGTDFDTSWDTLSISDITDITASAAQINVLASGFYDATSSVQTQINLKQNASLSLGSIWVGNSLGLADQLTPATNGQVLTLVGGVPVWQTISGTGTVTAISGSGGTTGLTLTPGVGTPITSSGTLSLGGTLIAANGGTGFASYGVGDILYANTTTTLAKLAAGTNTHILTLAGGVPTWSAPITQISGLTSGRVTFATSATTIGDDANLVWDGANKRLDLRTASRIRFQRNDNLLNFEMGVIDPIATNDFIINAVTSPTGFQFQQAGTTTFGITNLQRFNFNNKVFFNTFTGSALADFQSTNQGLVLPRALRSAITTPENGMLTVDTNVPYFHNGTSWINLLGGGGGITNTAATNEIPKSNGTNIVPSGIFTTTSGIITTGTWNGTAINPIYGGTGLTGLGLPLQQIRVNGAGTAFEYFSPPAGTSLSALTGGVSNNSLDNGGTHTWSWNSLTNTKGFLISSNSPNASVNAQRLFNVELSGANFNSSEITYAASVSNTHTGTSSTNVALNLLASGGTVNRALNIAAGEIALNESAGTSGQVLTSQGANATPIWATPSGGVSGLTSGRVTFATSGTTIGDDAAFTVDATIGRLNVIKSQSSGTNIVLANTSTASSSSATFVAANDAGLLNVLQFGVLGINSPTSGIFAPDISLVRSTVLGGLNIGSTNSAQVSFYTNNVRRGGFLAGGNFDFVNSVSVNGSTAIGASTALDIQGTTKALKIGSATIASIVTPLSGHITNDTNVPYFHNGTSWNAIVTLNTNGDLSLNGNITATGTINSFGSSVNNQSYLNIINPNSGSSAANGLLIGNDISNNSGGLVFTSSTNNTLLGTPGANSLTLYTLSAGQKLAFATVTNVRQIIEANGNISLFRPYSPESYGGGVKTLYFDHATTNPSTSVTGGGVMFVKSSDSKPYWWTGTTEYAMTGGGGASNSSVSTVSTSTALTITGIDQIVRGNLSANITTTLPTAVGNSGYKIWFKRVDATAFTWTIDAEGSETIDGFLNFIISGQWTMFGIYSNGTNWEVLN